MVENKRKLNEAGMESKELIEEDQKGFKNTWKVSK